MKPVWDEWWEMNMKSTRHELEAKTRQVVGWTWMHGGEEHEVNTRHGKRWGDASTRNDYETLNYSWKKADFCFHIYASKRRDRKRSRELMLLVLLFLCSKDVKFQRRLINLIVYSACPCVYFIIDSGVQIMTPLKNEARLCVLCIVYLCVSNTILGHQEESN